jgi:putative two-component system response regulator
VLVVDDTADNLTLMTSLLKDTYRVKVAVDGEKALSIASSPTPPDLVLLDVMMPGIDGYEVCRRLKANGRTADIPVLFLTARTDTEGERMGLDLGAVDYITKPISPPIVLARVRNHLLLKEARDLLADQNAYLEQEVARRIQEIAIVQDVTIMAMSSLCEARDNETGNHIRRTQSYVRTLAERAAAHPKFKEQLPPHAVELMVKSAPLHDIGKVGIPDTILLKPGRLTTPEFARMKEHTRIGKEAIEAAERLLESPSSFLAAAREIAYCHHEKWDGSGYPAGLRGESIPLSARLMAIADVYDALVSKRVYKPAMPHDQAVEIVAGEAGTHFDPELSAIFLEVAAQFRDISEELSDEVPENAVT